jgi:NADPH:quinone reductase-like Zn-dependent oxidoreductase
MKAVLLKRHGGNENLEIGVREDPKPARGEVGIKVETAAFNRLDLFVRNGIPGVKLSFPHVPGADAFGRVEEIGEGVTRVKVGDPVVVQPGLSCGRCEFCRDGEISLCVDYGILGEHAAGTFAEKVVVPDVNVYPAPPGLSPEECAAFPLAGMTAWRMLITRARLCPGETVLIHGIGGGVSIFALQIARLCGASTVFVTSSSDAKLEKAKALGADVCLNYTKEDVGKRIRDLTAKRGVDVVVDSVGQATWRASLSAAAKRGRIVTCGATSGANPEEEIRIIFWKQLDILGSTMGNDREFQGLLNAVGAGRVRPVVDEVFPMEDAVKAYERLASIEGFGKVVLRIS